MAIKSLNDYIKDNEINMNQKYTTKQIQDITWTNKQKQNLTRYQPKKKKNIFERSIATVDDLGLNIAKGFLNTTEGIADTISYLEADVVDLFGAKNYAKEKREAASRNLIEEVFDNKAFKDIEEQSYAGNFVRNVAQGIGNVGAFVGSSYLTGGTALGSFSSSFTSAYGNATSEALRNGADMSTARKAGLINGTAEAISEQIFEGIPGMKVEGWGSKIVGKVGTGVEKYFNSQTGKLVMKALNASGEGFEEIISNMLVATGNDVMHLADKNYTYGMEKQTGNVLKDLWGAATSQESWNAFLSATLTSAFTNGANTLISANQKNAVIKSYAQENNMTVKEVKDMFKQSVKEKTEIQKLQLPNMDLRNQVQIEEQSKIKTLQELKDRTFVQPGTETEAYKYQETNNQKINDMNKSLSEVANNTQQTREVAALGAKLINDLNLDVKFTDSEQIKQQLPKSSKLDGKQINGYVKDGVMYINVDSDQLANFTIGHETKHFFEQNKEMNDLLNKSLKEYAQLKGTYEQDLARIAELYKDEDGKQVGDYEAELMADYAGKFFTDQNFVNNLSVKQKSLFTKLKDFFQKMYYKATNQKEKLLLKEINDNFNKAYREYVQITGGKISSIETQLFEQQNKERVVKKQEQKQKVKQKQEVILPITKNIETKKKKVNKIESKEKYSISEKKQQTTKKKTMSLNEQLEKQGTKILEQAELKKQGMIDNFKEYLEENEITKPTQKDIDNSLIDILGYDNEDMSENAKNEKLYNKYVREYMEENNIPFEEKNAKYSITQDNRGKKLSEEQQEYFKDSKVRDKNGNLMVMYHGSQNDFSIFNKTFGGWYGDGYYFTDNRESGIDYAKGLKDNNGKLYETYLNITNPYIHPADLINEDGSVTFAPSFREKFENDFKNDIPKNWNDIGITEQDHQIKTILQKNGYDGINNGDVWVAFDSNQIKNIDNTNPTSDSDIRYSLSQELDDYLNKNKFTLDVNGNMSFENLTSKQITALASIYRKTGYSDVSSEYLKNKLSTFNGLKVPREVADRFIQQELGYKPKIDTTKVYEDAEGNQLTKEQVEFYKDSDVRDIRGRLIPVYHKTNAEFTVFDKKAGKQHGNKYGKGFYFSITPENYGNNEMKVYLNAKEGEYKYIPSQGYYVVQESNQIKNVDNTNPTDSSDIRYSLSVKDANTGVDSKGRKLSENQKEYFKNSKVIDENGNLKVMYNGSGNHTVFLPGYMSDESIWGKGVYLTPYKAIAKNYGNDLKEAYVNIEKPFGNEKNLTFEQYNEFYKATHDGEEAYREDYDMYDNDFDLLWDATNKGNWADYADELKKYTGYDGLIVDNPDASVTDTMVIAFKSNQVKNVNNLDPTENEDINLLLSQKGQDLSEQYKDFYKPKVENKIKLSDLKRKELELPYVEGKPLTPLESEQKQGVKTKEEVKTKKEVKKKTKKLVYEELQKEMNITNEDLDIGKDISALGYQRTDPIRLNEKVFGSKVGTKINEATIRKTTANEAERIRFLNKERQEIADLGIKPRTLESAAVQKYGEKQYVDDNGKLVKYGDEELAKEFKDKATQEKIKNAAKFIRNKYDTYIDSINDVITELGYDPIPKRKDYMRHFQEINDKLSEWGIPLNRKSLSEDALPTDINGITDQFKPGKNWFASALQRKGFKTTLDAIVGIDGYLEGASNLIYHTEDIQRYRALSKQIRETYGKMHGLDNLDSMTEEQRQKRLEDVFGNKLSKYVAWLDEQANALAGKKGAVDRAAESLLGRRIYSILDTAKKQTGSNMTGFNVRSALTNFASAVQGASKTQKVAFVKGTISTIKNMIHNDGLINKSTFLTNRFGSKQLAPKLWQKISNAGQIFMNGTDYFTANQIWRGKYYENLAKGMNETQAIKSADDFASRIMGDRSKGMTAQAFNSRTLGLLTQFQLEVNNQWSSIFHDNKFDLDTNNKSGATVLFQLGQLTAFSYFFNNFMKAITGTDVMIDPIDILKKLLGIGSDEPIEDRATSIFADIVNDLPFVSFLTGGRIPISEAFTGLETGLKYATGQKDRFGNKIKLSDVGKDLLESSYYWLLPTGYGQLRKTKQGLSMYDKDLPIAGSYTDSGRLRFEADTTPGGVIKAALFGQYSSQEARDYFDKSLTPLTEKQVQEAKDMNLPIKEYREINDGIKEAKAVAKENGKSQTEAMYNYIYDLPISTKKKNTLLNSRTNGTNTVKDDNGYIKYEDEKGKTYWYDKETDTLYNNKYKIMDMNNVKGLTKVSTMKDISDYGKYGSLEEFNYSNNNPEKYLTISQITDFDTYNQYKDEISAIKQRYDGSSTDTKKKVVYEYINSLPLSIEQKIMLQKMAGNYSIKQYKSRMQQYINSLNLTVKEKQTIENELFN